MVGEREIQRETKINYNFLQRLIPSMRKSGTKRLLYQAGGFSKPHDAELSFIIWALRKTIARSFEGQHQDNDAVGAYLAKDCMDIEWINHRAGIGGDGSSKGTLQRAVGAMNPSIGTHRDCADYSYAVVLDDSAIHTSSFSRYK